jgi:hypothetical protein
MNDTNSNGYSIDTDNAYGSSGYNSPGYQSPGYEALGYQSPGYGNGTGYGSTTDAMGYQQVGYTPPDTWASGYQENIYDRANLFDTPYLDTATNPNPSAGTVFDPYGSSANHNPYRSYIFELEQ